MSDAAFKSAPYSSYTTAELRDKLAIGAMDDATANAIAAEIARRDSVEAGDWSAMTPSERLRALREREAAVATGAPGEDQSEGDLDSERDA